MPLGIHNSSFRSKLFEGNNSKWMHWDSKIVKRWSLISSFDCKMHNSEVCYLKQEIKDNSKSKITDFSSHSVLWKSQLFYVYANHLELIKWLIESPQVPSRAYKSLRRYGCLFQSRTFKKGFSMRIQKKTDLMRVKGQALEHALHTLTFPPGSTAPGHSIQ